MRGGCLFRAPFFNISAFVMGRFVSALVKKELLGVQVRTASGKERSCARSQTAARLGQEIFFAALMDAARAWSRASSAAPRAV